jgi:hypothetical protein
MNMPYVGNFPAFQAINPAMLYAEDIVTKNNANKIWIDMKLL